MIGRELTMESNRLEIRPTEERRPCIWMQAGVVKHKLCTNDYDCAACRFDRVMQLAADRNKTLREEGITPPGKRGNIVSWKDKLKEYPPRKRPCIHHLKGRIDFRPCTHEYRCGDCEFDQYFYDRHAVHAVVRPIDFMDIKGFKVPQGYYIHRGHAWVKIEEGSEVRVGLDDFALRVMGPFDRMESPLIGKEVEQNRPHISLIRGEHHARAQSPVSGVVTSMNAELRERGDLAGRNPYTDGWIMTVHSDNLRCDLKSLTIGSESMDFMGDEVERLYVEIEDAIGPLASDGGHIGHDLFGKIPQIGWNRLTRLFLRT